MTTLTIMKALGGMMGLVPIIVLTGVLFRIYGLRPEITGLFWTLGGTIGIFTWLMLSGRGVELVPAGPHLLVLAIGVFIGAGANVLVFQAIGSGANPGIAMSIVNMNSVMAFFTVLVLSWFLPRFFEGVTFSVQHLIGLCFCVTGTALIALKR